MSTTTATTTATDPGSLADLFSLEGKRALVTGGTSGIGEMIAAGLVRAGATVYVTSRKAEACERTAEELSAFGTCVALPADVSSQDGCVELASRYAEREDRLDVLVNAAGTTWGAPLEEYPDKAWAKVMDLNVKAIFQLTVALLPSLEAAASDDDPARVLNLGSVHGFVPPTFTSYAYSASKGAVHQLTRHLAKHLGERRIAVNAIAPGPFPSRMMDATIEEHEDELLGESVLGRLGEPADMAGVAIYLSSRAGRHVTGAVIPVDGGYGTTR
jgi:NAD(P)-dependent dehydrogenase (short-subunit alcohol dehydrogenase family)